MRWTGCAFCLWQFHFGLPGAHGGFLGVVVFFVLSVFLITSLLLGRMRAEGEVGPLRREIAADALKRPAGSELELAEELAVPGVVPHGAVRGVD